MDLTTAFSGLMAVAKLACVCFTAAGGSRNPFIHGAQWGALLEEDVRRRGAIMRAAGSNPS